MTLVTDAVLAFLRSVPHNAPELIERWTPFMETQVNVAAGDGEPVEGMRNTWTNGLYNWFNIRIPKNANSEPEYRDFNIPFPLEEHAEGIGSTGWDWSARKSRWVGYDFDSLTAHAAGVGISDEELDRVREAARALPYVEVRKSTGGNGLHLYVYFDEAGVPTANHTEHAALARAVLGLMASETGFDFASQIDACGGNMWIWHRKMSNANQGLKLLKAAERPLTIADLPSNWRDHIEVVTRRRAKVRVQGLTDDQQDPFESLASARRIIPLDEKHKEIINALEKSGYSCFWVPDHHLLQTHTKAFEWLTTDRGDLGIKGFFQTISEGRDKGTPNCFAFPLENGGWKVYRFSPGIAEAPTWSQNNEGWTTCYFNRRPDLLTASRAFGGNELPDEKGFTFDLASDAMRALEYLGERISIPKSFHARPMTIRANKDGRLVVETKRESEDQKPSGFALSPKKDRWTRVCQAKAETKTTEDRDDIVRVLVTPEGASAGVYVRSVDGTWDCHPRDLVKMAIGSHGFGERRIKDIIGAATLNRWTRVSIPFAPEFLPDRQWNHNAAQLLVAPATDEGEHAHWDRILAHIGQSLDSTIPTVAAAGSIRTGADYLRAWLACLIRAPLEPLPYLFLVGPENSGKSILHEACSLLFTRIVKADRALTSASDFNGELDGAILCVVEERDLSKTPGAANKIKDAVTSRTLAIRKMRTDVYQVPNTTHWIQCANYDHEVAIKSGDTRITVLVVPRLTSEIPKLDLLKGLADEAPFFLRTLLQLDLPKRISRLRLPVVETAAKQQIADKNSPISVFLREMCEFDLNAKLTKGTLFKSWQPWAIERGEEPHDPKWFGKELPAASQYRIYADGTKAVDPNTGKRSDAYVGVRLRSQAVA
ncbi:MAG: DUF5906 domain-containing protein [Pirellulales bacterium]